MSDGHVSLALARLASAARDLGTREGHDLAAAVAAIGLAYDSDNEDLLIELLGICADGYMVFQGCQAPVVAREIVVAAGVENLRYLAKTLDDEDALCGLASIGVCAVSIEYFRRNHERLDQLAGRMSVVGLAAAREPARAQYSHAN